MLLSGKVKSKKKFLGHQILASCNEKIQDDSHAQKPFEESTDVEKNGQFVLDLPDKRKLIGSMLIEVMAPDGEILKTTTLDTGALPERIEIDCDPKEFFAIPEAKDPTLGKRMKIVGRALDRLGRRKISKRQVILYGHPIGSNSNVFEIVLATNTDDEGYFSGEYPRGQDNVPKKYSKAYGIVATAMDERIPIIVDEANLISRKVILVTDILSDDDNNGRKAMDDCESCVESIPRNPDAEDFANSPTTFTTDLGGGKCVDITIPNRALEEFDFYSVIRTTEPQIVGLNSRKSGKISKNIIDWILEDFWSLEEDEKKELMIELKMVGVNLKDIISYPERFLDGVEYDGDFSAIYRARKYFGFANRNEAGRAKLSKQNPVDWDGDTSFYQSSSIAHGHILHFKQTWKADGYSLGDLLYSLPLAPCQKKQVAVIDWDRREAASRSESLTEEERLAASLGRDRDINEIVSSTLSESLRGGSVAKTAGIGMGHGGAASGSYEMFNFGAVHGIGGGVGVADSTAWQDSARSLAASSLQTLRDKTSQSASAFRNMRSTVITTAQQGEAVQVRTEVVANHNHCHAITMEYFEVLRHLQVSTELVDVQECLFIPLLRYRFDSAKTLRWQNILQTYLQRPDLNSAFDATRRVQTNWSGVDTPLEQYADGRIISLRGELHLTFFIPLPPLDVPTGPNVDPAKVAEAMAPTTGFIGTVLAIFTGGVSIVAGAAAQQIAQGAAAITESLAKEPSAQQRYEKFHREVMPEIAANFVDQLQLFVVVNGTERLINGIDFTLVSDYRPGGQLLVSFRGRVGLTPPIARSEVTNLIIRSRKGLPSGCRVIINDLAIRYRTSSFEHLLSDEPKLNDDLHLPLVQILGSSFMQLPGTGDGATVDTPTDSWEQRNPRKEDIRLEHDFLDHLNSNLEYYHHAIWWNMDDKRRFNLLDGFLAPNSNGRSVASVLENRLIGIVGNSVIMPVARGFHLDPTYNQDSREPDNLLKLYAPNTPIPSLHITIPTRGVFAESVMGSCNSCEQKDDTKFWRFEESPCDDEPTLIQPLSAESRRSEPQNLTPQPFPTPMINIQNTPATPDPTALSEGLKLLGTPNLFKDVTGLDQNQKNALQALISSLDAAKFFGGEATKLVEGQQRLAMQKSTTQDSDKLLKTIKDAEKEGLIDKEEASKLTSSLLGRMVGEQEKEGKKITDEPEVKNLLNSASDTVASDVQINRPSESVSIKKGETLPDADTQTKTGKKSGTPSGTQNVGTLSDAGSIQIDGTVTRGSILFYNFDVGKATLKPKFVQALKHVAMLLNASPQATAKIEGRASQTGGEANNLALSFERAKSVHLWLIDPKKGKVDPSKITGRIGLGSSSPILNARGKEVPINRSVKLIFTTPTRAIKPGFAADNDLEAEEDAAGTNSWAITTIASATVAATIAGQYVTGALMSIKENERKARWFEFFGAGIGIGLKSKLLPPTTLPSVSSPDWNYFKTDKKYSFETFDGRIARYTAGEADAFVGYSIAYMSFPLLGDDAQSIPVGGAQYGSVGASVASTVGWFRIL